MTIWEPIKVFKTLRWDRAISAEDYLRANLAAAIFFVLVGFGSVTLGLGVGYFQGFVLGDLRAIPEDKWEAIFSFHPVLMAILIPMVLGSLFFLVFSIKLAIMRLHDFDLSGWWLLPVIGIFFVLGYSEGSLLTVLIYSLISFFEYFYNPKNPVHWVRQADFAHPVKGLEYIVLFIFTICVWYGILGDPVFAIIEMLKA